MNNIRNYVQLVGRVGKDIELKVFDQGKTLASFPLATNDYYKNSRGEKVQDTQWHRCVAWGKTAELLERLLSKGTEVIIHGKLMNRSYEGNDGQTKYTTEIVVSEFVAISKTESKAA